MWRSLFNKFRRRRFEWVPLNLGFLLRSSAAALRSACHADISDRPTEFSPLFQAPSLGKHSLKISTIFNYFFCWLIERLYQKVRTHSEHSGFADKFEILEFKFMECARRLLPADLARSFLMFLMTWYLPQKIVLSINCKMNFIFLAGWLVCSAWVFFSSNDGRRLWRFKLWSIARRIDD